MERRVLGFVAHVDSGKTTLSEAVLFETGRLRSRGRVDKGDSFFDSNEIERERGITVFSKQAVFETGGVEFTLIDTPGHVDLSTEMERALLVLDAAVLVVSGPEGIEAHTRTLARLLKAYDVPTVIFVNKMDRCEKSRDIITQELKDSLFGGIVDFSGLYENNAEQVYEEVALCDEKLLDEFMEKGEITAESIADAVGMRTLMPCVFGSALNGTGIKELLDVLARFVPTPAREEEGEFSGLAFKIGYDDDGRRLTYIKVTSGTLEPRGSVSYDKAIRTDEDEGETLGKTTERITEKVSEIRVYESDGFKRIDKAYPGMVIAVPGLTHTKSGTAFGKESEDNGAMFMVPVMTYAVLEKDKTTLHNIEEALKKLEEEDPALNVIRDSRVSQLKVSIMGEIRLEILKRQLLDRFGMRVPFGIGKVLYKETITAPVLGVGHFEPLRHYAEVSLLMEPAERGSGISVVCDLPEDEFPSKWQHSVRTHILEKTHKGALLGAGITDIKITIASGRAHQKHTEGGDFREATYRAIRQGLVKAAGMGSAIVLEPWCELLITAPASVQGRIASDLEQRCARIISTQVTGEEVLIRAAGPASTTEGYVSQLLSSTKGLASVSSTYIGYMPCHNQDEVVSEAGYNPLEDLSSPAGSVFCAHGAGMYVEWNEVDAYKHTQPSEYALSVLGIKREANAQTPAPAVFKSPVRSGPEDFVSVEEVDAILERLMGSNKKGNGRKNPYRKYKSKNAVHATGKTSPKPPPKPQNSILLVDGYNIIHAWSDLKELARDDIDAAALKLNDIMSDYAAASGKQVMIVYDAYKVHGHDAQYLKVGPITVVYTAQAQTADRFIERYAHENSPGRTISVATSDSVEGVIVRGAGCNLISAAGLLSEVEAVKESVRDRLALL